VRILLAVLAAAATTPAVHHTAGGTKAARTSLLRLSDLGKGWSGKASAQTGLRLNCSGHAVSGSGLVETGAAASPSFSYGKTGPFISQETSVFATGAQANAYWRRGVTQALANCVAQSLEAVSVKGVRVTLVSAKQIPIGAGLAHEAEFRVVGRLHTSANTLTNYFDVILLGRGKTITELTVSSFQSAVPASVEAGLARLVARRLGATGAA